MKWVFYLILHKKMLNLLLMLILMTTPTQTGEVKLIPTQTVIERSVKSVDDKIDDIGTASRPLSSRMQTRDIYLDLSKLTNSQSIPNLTVTQLTWFTYETSGKYRFNNTGSDWIIIPKWWTYQIIWTLTMPSLTNSVAWSIKKNWSSVYSTFGEKAPFTYIYVWNFSLNDVVTFEFIQQEWSSITVNSNITIVKMS